MKTRKGGLGQLGKLSLLAKSYPQNEGGKDQSEVAFSEKEVDLMNIERNARYLGYAHQKYSSQWI